MTTLRSAKAKRREHRLNAVSRTPIAVAVVSWNTRDLLARCLRSLEPDSERGIAEVWVVDNASSDGSPDMVREEFPWVKLIASEENLGFGRAVNAVAERTSTDWIVASNEDVAVRPGALDALLEAGARDPGAGAIAPRLVLPDGSTQHSAFGFPTIPYALVLATFAYHVFPALGDRFAIPAFWDKERARRVPWAIAAFLMIRRGAWDEVGGFDMRQWMSGEDLDLGWRLKAGGWATRYEPRAVVDHEGSVATSKVFGDELIEHWQRATYGSIVRRRGLARAWAVALLNFAGAVNRALLAPPRNAESRRGWWRWGLVQLRALRGRDALERPVDADGYGAGGT
jgi:N-acetylglucosaminyl-diphospho-decaprenol L-rhamnosyltransferase